jgi:hypothetical protein
MSNRKLIANGCVFGWSMFWVFGFLALSAPVEATGQVIGAAVLSFAGLLLGLWCYIRLIKGAA